MPRIHTAIGSLTLTAALLAWSAAAGAQTRTETLRWSHGDPAEVQGYKVYYGPGPRNYDQELDVGLPPLDATNAHVYDLVVPEGDSIYVAVTAYNQDEESAFSNEKYRPGVGGNSDPPPPPPPPSGDAQSAVIGFALWNADTDQVVDSDFRSGEVIDLATQSCTAIEILGNSYLDQAQSPGSVYKVFNGNALSCNQAPTSHENSAPFAWETDRGPGRYDCAVSLQAVGQHTLTVTPYDGDDCGGEAGESVTLTFEVIDSNAPGDPPGGGEPGPLGQPGQPQLLPPLP